MKQLWCVRAEFGKYSDHFVKGGYVAIGWLEGHNLSGINKEDLYTLYKQFYPKDTSNVVIGQQVGQISRFLFDVKPGDYVITPSSDTDRLYYGEVLDEPYYLATENDGCPYKHRKKVKWSSEKLLRSNFSVPFQNTIRAMMTVFYISHLSEFLEVIGEEDPERGKKSEYDPYKVVLKRLLSLSDKEFEMLVGHLLVALGFDGTEVTGKVGDGGVDVKGDLNIAGLAKVALVVQTKRYKIGSRINASDIRKLRGSIPIGGQGAFITTADFQKKAKDAAIEPGFPRIGLINGRQLVDLLVEHWNKIDPGFQSQLGLIPGLVLRSIK